MQIKNSLPYFDPNPAGAHARSGGDQGGLQESAVDAGEAGLRPHQHRPQSTPLLQGPQRELFGGQKPKPEQKGRAKSKIRYKFQSDYVGNVPPGTTLLLNAGSDRSKAKFVVQSHKALRVRHFSAKFSHILYLAQFSLHRI